MPGFTWPTAERIARATQRVELGRRHRLYDPGRANDRLGTMQFPTLAFADEDIADGSTGAALLALGATPGSESAGTDPRTIVNVTGRTIWDGSLNVIEHTPIQDAAAANWYAIRGNSASIAYGTAFGDVTEGNTGTLISVQSLGGYYGPTSLTYRVIEGETETGEKVIVHWSEADQEWQHFCCIGGMDVFFRVSATDTGGVSNYWVDKVIAYNGQQTFDSAADLPMTFEIGNAGTDEDVTIFYDMSATPSYTPNAFEVLGIDASNNTRMYSPADGYAHNATQDIPVSVDAATTVGEMQFGINSDSLTNYSSIAVQTLSKRATGLPIWMDYADTGTVNGTQDVRITFDFTTTTDNLIAYWDLSQESDYDAGTFQWFTHDGSGDPGWLEMVNAQSSWEASEDFLISWFIDAGTNHLRFFIEGDNLTGYTAAHPENMGHNSSGTWVSRNYADYQASETYNASNHIPVWMTEEGASKETARLYLDPDGVPGTDPASGETAAVSISYPSTAFSQTLIDAAFGGAESTSSQTVTSTSGADLTLDAAVITGEHVTFNASNDTLVLGRDGIWNITLWGQATPTTGSGTQVNEQLRMIIRDRTAGVDIEEHEFDVFSLGDDNVVTPFCFEYTGPFSSGDEVGPRALTGIGTSVQLNRIILTAKWLGVSD